MAAEPTVLFGVGATKAGTSWLHEYLLGHPDCHFRSLKEMHYFDTLETQGFRRQIDRIQTEVDRLTGKLTTASGLKAERLQARLRDHADWLAVLKSRPTDHAMYGAYLLDGTDRRLVGDITPAYSLLPVPRLQEMAGLAADVRFVYLLRDPVSRLWSHVRMVAQRKARGEAFDALAKRLMDRVLEGDTSGVLKDIVDRGDYAEAMLRLSSAVQPAQLLVQFMEDLISAPGVAQLCEFLGIRPHPGPVERRVHEGVPLGLDAARRARARVLLAPQYEFVAQLFPALPEAWRRNMDGLAA